MQEVQDLLLRPNMPDGIKKWQLPIVISEGRPSFAFITLCSPKAHTPMHMHPDDAIIRVIMSGSITIKCKDPDRCVELTHGDWMYVPNTVPYSYTAGPLGASIFHMYNCGGGDDDITTDYWKIHGFPGGGLKIFNGLPKSEVPKDWFENSN
ncbi:AraC family ligand binding domain-containing protein [Vibrio parahaemolyticus]|nr:AraC family ligand binding domain-containing protein [Vibrio parahaemolyticus]